MAGKARSIAEENRKKYTDGIITNSWKATDFGPGARFEGVEDLMKEMFDSLAPTLIEYFLFIGTTIYAANIMNGIGQSIARGVWLAPDSARAFTAAHDIFAIIDRVPAIDSEKKEVGGENEDEEVVNNKSHHKERRMCLEQNQKIELISYKNVNFRYPLRQDQEILKGLSFRIKAGQSVGLCGPTGSGKSSILALLERFYDPNYLLKIREEDDEVEVSLTEKKKDLENANIGETDLQTAMGVSKDDEEDKANTTETSTAEGTAKEEDKLPTHALRYNPEKK